MSGTTPDDRAGAVVAPDYPVSALAALSRLRLNVPGAETGGVVAIVRDVVGRDPALTVRYPVALGNERARRLWSQGIPIDRARRYARSTRRKGQPMELFTEWIAILVARDLRVTFRKPTPAQTSSGAPDGAIVAAISQTVEGGAARTWQGWGGTPDEALGFAIGELLRVVTIEPPVTPPAGV